MLKTRLRFPIRWKILITLLFVVTLVVGLITLTMARMFHDDKKTYIHDLSSIVALNVADETQSLLAGYAELLRTYSRIMTTESLGAKDKAKMLQGFFGDFHDLIGISLVRDGEEVASAYDARSLEAAGISKDDVARHRAENPLPLDRILDGEVFIRYAPLSADLPAFTMSVARTAEDDSPASVISALVRLDSLEGIALHSQVFEVFLIDSQGTLLAHRDVSQIGRRADATLLSLLSNLAQDYSAGMTREYTMDGVEMVGGFANAGAYGVRTGAQIPRSAAFLASRDLLRNLIIVAGGLLLLATILSLFWSRRITRSVERLSDATREIAKGKFEVQVDVTSRDEIGTLATSFNQMTSELKTREEELEGAQRQLVQSEKMAAFGQLGAGIAHEVKNPLAGILGCAQLSIRKAEKNSPVFKNLQLIEKETKRCKEIIESLLKFARQEKASFNETDVNAVCQDAMAIVRHQLEMSRVKLEGSLAGELPLIQGNANQIQQVLMNLMMNAQQAMEGDGGTVRVVTKCRDSGHIEIHVADDGPGMPPEVREKVFEPFFTTKPGGKGTGLGLSVSFGIIRDHNGRIRVESEPGKGTTFVITLPVPGKKRSEAASGKPAVVTKNATVETIGGGQ